MKVNVTGNVPDQQPRGVAPLYFPSPGAVFLLWWISNLLHILPDFAKLKIEHVAAV